MIRFSKTKNKAVIILMLFAMLATLLPVSAFAATTPNTAAITTFVDSMYTVLLGRPADTAGEQYWVDQLSNQTMSAAQVVSYVLLAAPEFQNLNLSTDEFLNRAYQTFFVRTPDAGGLSYWTDQMSQGQTERWVVANMLGAGGTDGEFAKECANAGMLMGYVGAEAPVASVSAVNPTIAVGQSTTFQFKDDSGNAVAAPSGVTYAVTGSNASSAVISSNGTFVATAAGSYTVAATFGTTTLNATVTVYGQAAGVKLSATSTSVIANGKTNAITATVVDASGATVSGFNGTATLSASPLANGGKLVNAVGTTVTSVTITNGVGTFYLQAPASVPGTPKDVITISNLQSTNGLGVASNMTYQNLTVNYTAQTASGLKVTPDTTTVSANDGTGSDNLTLNVTDASGANVSGTLAAPVYVTLAITGPGSFTQVTTANPTPTTSTTIVMTTGSTTQLLYPVQGQTGTITVTASATGYTNATATINSVLTGLPANFTLSAGSTATLNASQIGSSPGQIPSSVAYAGEQYTVYTVTFVDANGNVVTAPSSEYVTVTDNNSSLTKPGVLNYYKYKPSDQTFTAMSAGTANNVTTSTFNFAVLNSTAGSGNVTITVADSVLGLNKTATYAFATGSAAKVGVAKGQATSISLTPGGSATVSLQLQDAAGNPVAQSGQNVYVWFTTTLTGVTVGSNLVAPSSVSNGYVATTNAQGIATLTVNVASTTSAGSFAIGAANSNASGTTDQLTTDIGGIVMQVGDAVSSLGYGSISGSTFTAATIPSAFTTTGDTAVVFGSNICTLNAINGPAQGNSTTKDTIQLTISDKNVLSLGTSTSNNGWTVNTTTGTTATISANLTGLPLPTIKGMKAGSATITVTDISSATQPSITFNVTVAAGTAATTPTFQYNGVTISSTNKLAVAANTAIAITVINADGGGNPVPVTGTTPDTIALSDGGNGGTFRLTANGSTVGQVSIPVGQTTATVYYVNPVAGSYYGFTGQTAAINSFAFAPLTSAKIVAGNVTITAKDQNGNPFAGATMYLKFTPAGTGTATVLGTALTSSLASFKADANGNVTVVYTASASGTDTLYAAKSDTDSSPASVTN